MQKIKGRGGGRGTHLESLEKWENLKVIRDLCEKSGKMCSCSSCVTMCNMVDTSRTLFPVI